MEPTDGADAREKILFYLKTKGPQTAGELADRLGVTAMAVRQHLYQLQEKGLVGYRDQRRRVGRPARVWRLTAAAAEQFPDSHAELAVGMIQAVRAAFGAAGIDRLIRERTAAQIASYGERMADAGDDVTARLDTLTRLRRREGYMAEWTRQDDGSYLFVENNCPICAAAGQCQGLCAGELELFRTVLGEDVTVARTEYILDGDRRCAYRVSAAAGFAA